MLSRPFLTRIPAPYLVPGPQDDTDDYVIATADSEGSYNMIYFPTGKKVLLDFSSLNGTELRSWWFDPRTGNAFPGPGITNVQLTIEPPSSGIGQDWVLVVDDAAYEFGPPGKVL